jgi:hypothetical protein
MNALADVCCASIPAAALPHLAALRTQAGLRIFPAGDRAWLRWDAGHEEVLRQLLPIEGAELFALRDGLWYRPGQHLPAFHVFPDGEGQPLARLLNPAPAQPETAAEPAFTPLPLLLVRDTHPRLASALVCPVAELARWADLATSRQLAALTGAVCGERVLVVGRPLPALAEGVRYWGRHVLTPLGFRPEPALPEELLREALGLNPDEVALLHPDGVEVLSWTLLAPLTRAGIRLALRGRG